ncbi:MAG: DUF692 family protein [Deltaproteobacteria bacterium]|nr:DUF692 family protein [Deltaproteobacteria bacterium]
MAHSSELALATTGRMNPEMVARLSEQVRQIGSAWAGEHFCLNSSIETGELGYNFAPLLDDETVAATVRNLRALEAAYGCRVAIEAGPRYYTWGERWDDHGAMREVAEETGCPIISTTSATTCAQ